VREPVRAAVIGLGFMGRTHVRAYLAAAAAGMPVRLVAVADAMAQRRGGRVSFRSGNLDTGTGEAARLFDPREVAAYPTPVELLARGDLDLVSVCTPTDTHVAVATAVLRAGAHVLLEKPVAITSARVRRLIEAEAASDRRVVPAMCMRHWPGWPWLVARIRDRRFGRLTSLKLVRLGSRPAWSKFYADPRRSGGAMFDLHLHDVDFLTHALGMPRTVTTFGTRDHVTTHYAFTGVQVSAEGGWLASPGRGFRMRYAAEFERATAEFDLGREPVLGVTRGGKTEPVTLPTVGGYEAEVRATIQWAAKWKAGRQAAPWSTLDQALAATRVIEAERRSLSAGLPVAIGAAAK